MNTNGQGAGVAAVSVLASGQQFAVLQYGITRRNDFHVVFSTQAVLAGP